MHIITLTKQRTSLCPAPQGDGAPKKALMSRADVIRVAKEEMLTYRNGDGLVLAEFEATYIASGIASRLGFPVPCPNARKR